LVVISIWCREGGGQEQLGNCVSPVRAFRFESPQQKDENLDVLAKVYHGDSCFWCLAAETNATV
jgi:hypothetical protein